MKRLVSLLLVAVMILSVGIVTAFAETPPYSESFDTTDELIAALEDYTQQFPNPDFSSEEIVAPSDAYHLEYKKVILPVLSEDFATFESCSILEDGFGGGINNINCTYIDKDSGQKYTVRGLYGWTEDDVDDKLVGFGDEKRDPNVHIGFVNGYPYSATETPYSNDKGRCDYRIVVDDVLFVCHTLKPFSYDIISNISFVKTEVEFPVYVRGEENLYEDRLLALYFCGDYETLRNSHYYEELYYHYDENNEVDWALVNECSFNNPPWNYHTIYKDRILMYGGYTPFSFRYGIYDVKEDKFYDILREDFDFSKYDELEETFDSFEPGYPIGDADFDKELSILDATFIQFALAQLSDFYSDDEIYTYTSAWQNGELKYMSDFDRDGERTILDATGIQLKLARLSY